MIFGLGIVVLLLAQFAGVQFLKREVRRHSAKISGRQLWLGGELSALSGTLEEVRRDLAGMEDQRRADAESFCQEETRTAEALRGVWSRLETLEKLGAKMDKRLEDSPALPGQESESSLSKAVEEGIANILGYSAVIPEART